ncbi:MAG: hypothetical protein A2268_04020 [Candidatus Raymondbacteria bacterium RifOxyA12_full_50_37]|uniref:Flagellar biosynthetic protein FliQ n=1 Tax=Candidatus Raymondbacteria bacterium RIFOXYD12_FULL_49_13 TaxID=1817890 RepID=A0A1F7FAT2_UNCRA|nr:MAG: hypothetical protein A2268_04020 [Candidatus Raymondbacteria bacterium RifOxyA12_full_50_37]OGJ92608.1 MAG: hypothetical protein A2248_05930 [Candidatus Raymondbacteria bacterium RIFOXYA2_FULL_49_16]OGJ97962.1 MAG: hypothetical protein A2453_02955 [Candidatus Raymondbacteria bacterium RIFOXYC2_FULL_50_21]OGJ98617.1 MAG: hypothetical protein A2487_05570 [Candidatus Raymondbacteria bacterium RifOxyC12_full_50_8]OGK01990.1 MAG: hypothetical protein A2350_21125 [Candidatus Raymondbacteria b
MVIDVGRDALLTTLMVSGPMLLAGLVIGLIVGIFQAVTQIHEMTLTFIPKIVAVGLVMLFTLPWMLNKFMDFTYSLIQMIPIVAH